jgi:hypothetical protein
MTPTLVPATDGLPGNTSAETLLNNLAAPHIQQ